MTSSLDTQPVCLGAFYDGFNADEIAHLQDRAVAAQIKRLPDQGFAPAGCISGPDLAWFAWFEYMAAFSDPHTRRRLTDDNRFLPANH